MDTLFDMLKSPKFVVDPITLDSVVINDPNGHDVALEWRLARAVGSFTNVVDLTPVGAPLTTTLDGAVMDDVMGSQSYPMAALGPLNLDEGDWFFRIVVGYKTFPEGTQAPFLRVRGTATPRAHGR